MSAPLFLVVTKGFCIGKASTLQEVIDVRNAFVYPDEKPSRESQCIRRLSNSKGEKFAVRVLKKHVGTYDTLERAVEARDHYKATGEKLPGSKVFHKGMGKSL